MDRQLPWPASREEVFAARPRPALPRGRAHPRPLRPLQPRPCAAAAPDQQQGPPAALGVKTAPPAALALAASAAVLGPCCDTLHSRWSVLAYARPTVDAPPLLVTCWWVPPLFAAAGVVMGLGVPLVDALRGRPEPARPWPAVLANIAAFVLIYALSAVLERPLRGSPPAMGAALAAATVVHWWAFDRTASAAVLGAAAAVAGPAVEVGLIQAFHLYTYADPAVFGAVPAWIPWVYAAGGAAVGGLGRRVVADLAVKLDDDGRNSTS